MLTKGFCFITKTGMTWEFDVKDEFDLMDQVKEFEEVNKIPGSWKLSIVKKGVTVEVNRSKAARGRKGR